MKRLFACLALLAGCFSLATPAVAATGTYSYCNVSGCKSGGSFWNPFSTYTKTKYPIVLAHGMSGFGSIGPIDYWYQMPQTLVVDGAQVYITQVAAFNDETQRGEQLLTQVKKILAITGAKKVNLIGHSQGGLDIRYVAGVAPQLVASVTSISTPHKGTDVADLIQSVSDFVGPGLSGFVGDIINALFSLVGSMGGHDYDQSSLAGLAQLTTAGMTQFNARFPAGIPTSECGQGAATANGIRFYSWGGTGHVTSVLDPSDYAMAALDLAFNGKQNDGLVPRCSNHLGVVLRDNYNYNHLDSVNQLLGLVSILEASPTSVLRTQANRLKNAGL